MKLAYRHITLLLSCYLLLGSLLPNMDFSQLTRLGTLRAHYLHHVEEAAEEGEACSFALFLYEHFIDFEGPKDTEHKDCHQDMPLNGINTVVSFCLSLNFQTPSLDLGPFSSKAPALESASPLAGYLPGVFQPPAV